jgi:comEA protein
MDTIRETIKQLGLGLCALALVAAPAIAGRPATAGKTATTAKSAIPAAKSGADGKAPKSAGRGAVKKSALTGKINLNTATVQELTKLPRIGEKVAQRIVEYRQKHGGFKKTEELMNVKGIGEKTFDKMREHLSI